MILNQHDNPIKTIEICTATHSNGFRQARIDPCVLAPSSLVCWPLAPSSHVFPGANKAWANSSGTLRELQGPPGASLAAWAWAELMPDSLTRAKRRGDWLKFRQRQSRAPSSTARTTQQKERHLAGALAGKRNPHLSPSSPSRLRPRPAEPRHDTKRRDNTRQRRLTQRLPPPLATGRIVPRSQFLQPAIHPGACPTRFPPQRRSLSMHPPN